MRKDYNKYGTWPFSKGLKFASESGHRWVAAGELLCRVEGGLSAMERRVVRPDVGG